MKVLSACLVLLAPPVQAATYTLTYSTSSTVGIAFPDEFSPSEQALSIDMVLELPETREPYFDFTFDSKSGSEIDPRVVDLTVSYDGVEYGLADASSYVFDFDVWLGIDGSTGSFFSEEFRIQFDGLLVASVDEGQYGAVWFSNSEPPAYKYMADGEWTVPSVVPLPATLPLAAVAWAGLIVLSRRRRAA